MRTAVQFGAGNIGRGFMGQLFWEAGLRTIFVEADPRLVDLLNVRGVYTLRLLDAHQQREVDLSIDGFEALHTGQAEAVAEAVAEAQILCTAVGVKNLPAVATLIAAGIRRRFQLGGPPLDVWLCENLLRAAPVLEERVLAGLEGPCLDWSRRNVGFVGTAVARMVPAPEAVGRGSDPLRVVSDAHHELPYDAAALRAAPPEIAGLRPARNFAAEMERKLFTHNLGHACLAYLGRMAGCIYVHEGFQDPWVSAFFDAALGETSTALVARYPDDIDAEGQARVRRDVRVRFGNPLLKDTVKRVAKDPIRKLGAGERLIGSGQLCLSAGVVPEAIATVCGAALRYDEAGDPEAVQLQRIIRERGVSGAISEVTGLDGGGALAQMLAQMIEDRYRSLASVRRA